MRGIAALLLALGGGFLAGAAPAQDLAAGRKVAGLCKVCHGMQGVAQVPIAPHIAGEPIAYITRQLAAFRSGERVHEMMSVVAKGLSDQQIADVAAWYSSHAASGRLPEGVDPADAPEPCAGCHGANGIALREDTPNLANETNIYIETQLKAFRTGKRTHEIMSEIARDMSDEEISAYADWFAAVRLQVTEPELPPSNG
jgi:cytochrome c553